MDRKAFLDLDLKADDTGKSYKIEGNDLKLVFLPALDGVIEEPEPATSSTNVVSKYIFIKFSMKGVMDIPWSCM